MKRLRKIKNNELGTLNPGDHILISTIKDDQQLWLRGWVSQNQHDDNRTIAVLKYVDTKDYWTRWGAYNELKRMVRLEGRTHPFILDTETHSNVYLVEATEVPDLFKQLRENKQLNQATSPYQQDQAIVYYSLSLGSDVAFTHGYFQARNFRGGVYRHQVEINGEDRKFSVHVNPFTKEVSSVILEEPKTITRIEIDISKERRKIEGFVQSKEPSSEDYQRGRTFLGPIEANAIYMRGIEEFNRGVHLLDLEHKIGMTIKATSGKSRPLKPEDSSVYPLWG